MIEREFKKLQEKHRDVLNSEYNLQTARDHLEISVKIAHEELQKINEQYEESAMRWKQERQDLVQKINEFSRAVDKVREDGSKNGSKCKQYKDKLRLANNSIKILSQKVAQYELERQAEREIDEIRVGSQQLEGGRDSHQSRASEVDFKDVIQKILNDDHLKQEMRRLIN